MTDCRFIATVAYDMIVPNTQGANGNNPCGLILAHPGERAARRQSQNTD